MTPACTFLGLPGPVTLFAHRGGAAEGAENSWSAFERALTLGPVVLETDVRLTADGVAVLFHDPTLNRMLGHDARLRRVSWARLREMRLPDGGPVPRLDEALSAWPDARWNIDIKVGGAVKPVTEAVARAGAHDRVLLTSFAGRRSAQARRLLGQEVATGASQAAIAVLLAAKRVPVAARLLRRMPSAAQVPVRRYATDVVDEHFVAACHSLGVAVHVWTVDDMAQAARLLDLGVDGLMTDRPQALRDLLAARGAWP